MRQNRGVRLLDGRRYGLHDVRCSPCLRINPATRCEAGAVPAAQGSPREGIGRAVPIPSGPVLSGGDPAQLRPRSGGWSWVLGLRRTPAGAAGAWQRIDAPMDGGSNDDLLRFVLVAAFLLAIVALLSVV